MGGNSVGYRGALFKSLANPPRTGEKRAEWKLLCVSGAMRGTLIRSCVFVSPVQPYMQIPPENLARGLEEGLLQSQSQAEIGFHDLTISP